MILPKDIWKRAVDWGLHTCGSTRSSALIRICLVCLIWSKWAGDLILPHTIDSWKEIFLHINFFLSTTLMFFGIWTRVSTFWTAGVVLSMYYYAGLIKGVDDFVHHHTYLLAFATFLCALTPCGKSYSVDRWIEVRKAKKSGRELPREWGNLWGLRLISLQLALIYFWTAYNKTTWAFLSGDQLERIYMTYYFGSDYPDLPGFHLLMIIVSWLTVLLEYALIGLLFQKLRKWLVIPGLLFHGLIYILLPVSTYSLTMWCLYLAFFDANKVHQVIDELNGSVK